MIIKDIIGYEGLYKINRSGDVLGIKRNNILKHLIKKGYAVVALSKDGKAKHFFIHQLVAKHFVLNKNNYKIINHKDGDKLNNYYKNLEWCTQQYNIKHSYDIGLRLGPKGNKSPLFGKIGKLSKISKQVNQYSICGKLIKTFDSLHCAQRELGIHISAISNVCNGKRKTAGGFIWEFNAYK